MYMPEKYNPLNIKEGDIVRITNSARPELNGVLLQVIMFSFDIDYKIMGSTRDGKNYYWRQWFAGGRIEKVHDSVTRIIK